MNQVPKSTKLASTMKGIVDGLSETRLQGPNLGGDAFSTSPHAVRNAVLDVLEETFPKLDVYDVVPLLTSVECMYAFPVREYHSVEHVTYMLQAAAKYGITLEAFEVLAIMFHDAVYVQGYNQNEQASADLCASMLYPLCGDSGEASNTVAQAVRVIEDTRLFLSPNEARDYSRRVLDLDIISLAEPDYDRWLIDRRKIREEMGISTEQDLKFFALLRRNRPQLYKTPELEECNAVAWQQIQRFVESGGDLG